MQIKEFTTPFRLTVYFKIKHLNNNGLKIVNLVLKGLLSGFHVWKLQSDAVMPLSTVKLLNARVVRTFPIVVHR